MSKVHFTFVTSNKDKIYFAHQTLDPLGIEFTVQAIPTVEIQTDDKRQLIEHKVKSAYAVLGQPVVVNDHWWEIQALGGFPGPYMHFLNDHLQAVDLIQLMHGKDNRAVTFTECVGYFDGNSLVSFFDEVQGMVLDTTRGSGVPGQQVFSLSGDGKSIAQHLEAGTDPRGKSPRQAWHDLANWLKQR